jgi:hypothetical protein
LHLAVLGLNVDRDFSDFVVTTGSVLIKIHLVFLHVTLSHVSVGCAEFVTEFGVITIELNSKSLNDSPILDHLNWRGNLNDFFTAL